MTWAVSGLRAARADDWTTLGLDGPRARMTAERSGATFSDGHWTYAPTGHGRVLSSPVVADGFAITADLSGNVSALHADGGGLVWRVNVGSVVQGTPAVARGRVYVPTLANQVVALALADGSTLWTADVGGMAVSSPAIVDADVVLAAGLPQRSLVRLNGDTGAIVWVSPPIMNDFSDSSPAVAGGLIVVGSNGGHFYGFDAATGAARWDYQADGVVALASPLVAGGKVFMAGGDDSDRVHAADLATGTAVPGWPVTLPAPAPDLAGQQLDRHRAVSSPISAGGNVVLVTRLDDSIDTDGDGVPDQFLSRELAIALDPAAGQVVWQRPLARTVTSDVNLVPKFFVCPTPAAFATAGGATLLAVASSLSPTVAVLDAATGNDLNDVSVAGPALASPVVANGRLITASFGGVVEGWLSAVNHPPAAPVPAANPAPLDASDVELHWLPATDPDAELPAYELRVDSDGEVLQSYAQRILLDPGTTSAHLTAPLSAGVTYTFAVRARDAQGADSAWSAPETFTVVVSPPVTLNGNPVAGLQAALESARPGDAIALSAGTYTLASTLHVGAGVEVAGAGAGRTVLDARGLGVGVSFAAIDPKAPTGLDKVTVTGSDTCISVDAGAAGIELTHLVAHDCATAAIAVAAGGTAAVANATLVSNGTGLDVAGNATIKNSLVSGNHVGLATEPAGALTSSYDDLFGNDTGRRGVAAGTGDFSAAVTFADAAAHDYRLLSPQPSTDKGDPADAVGDEPLPDGGRINLGAFGGTADAEPSATSNAKPHPQPPPGSARTPTVGDPAARFHDPYGGCGLAGAPAPRAAAWSWGLILAALALSRRRARGR
jgi:outer membrane protein assembly factor BamB